MIIKTIDPFNVCFRINQKPAFGWYVNEVDGLRSNHPYSVYLSLTIHTKLWENVFISFEYEVLHIMIIEYEIYFERNNSMPS